MRKKIAAANWKMHLRMDEALQLARSISSHLNINSSNTVILAAPYVYLKSLSDLTFPIANLHVAAQNCFYEDKGAFTGEISSLMLQSINIEYAIIGHSERRTLFDEDDLTIRKKVDKLISEKMNIIYCCGETLENRRQGEEFNFVENQLKSNLLHLEEKDFESVIIAYEPIWAIGTGETASPEQAQEMHAHIRKVISREISPVCADNLSILYGGSVKPDNAPELFGQPDVDGGLVGGASLNAETFIPIIDALGA